MDGLVLTADFGDLKIKVSVCKNRKGGLISV